ncbi:MAG: cytochrome c oxidase assembly protein subunit 15 [Oleispira sp.]|jgi:cytochrome c oxidase assembly protein subunit 15
MDKKLLSWVRLNLLITIIVITLGALARLLDAGLGCPDWPGCYGQIIPPQGSEEIQKANASHPLFPVEQVKAWSEMIHRFAASALGFSLLLFAIWVSLKTEFKTLRSISYVALGWVILQGIFGMLTVTLRIWPPVVTLHLLAGMMMLAIIFWQYQLIKEPNKSLKSYQLKNIAPRIRYPLLAVILITVLQMGLGGWTSSHYAGLACPDLPQCQSQWWPETVHGPFHAPMVDAQQYLGGLLPMADRMAIQILHRLTACLLILSAFLLCYRMYNSPHRKLIGFILVPLTLQVLIGIGNVFLLLPLSLALLHNTGAALFWLCLWTVYFSMLKAEVRND